MSPQVSEAVCRLLQKRCEFLTIVELRDDRRLEVFNIAWGQDIAADYDHIKTNISPIPKSEYTIDFFFTSDLYSILDGLTGETLFEDRSTLI